jgi:hypothetical protein
MSQVMPTNKDVIYRMKAIGVTLEILDFRTNILST